MRKTFAVLPLCALALLASCDDGPEQAAQPIEESHDDVRKLFPMAAPGASEVPKHPARIEVHPQQVTLTTRNPWQSLEVRNSGERTATIRAVRVAGSRQSLAVEEDCTARKVVPGEGCTVTLKLAGAGGERTAELILTHDGSGGVATVPVRIAGQPPRPVYRPGLDAVLEAVNARRETGLAEGGTPAWIRHVKEAETGESIDWSRVVTADRTITISLDREIVTELEGEARGTVERHVYGAAGRRILIPAGSKVIGRYAGIGTALQTRIPIQWTRIVTPRRKELRIEASTADPMGRTGAIGYIDRRYVERYGVPLLITTLEALVTALTAQPTVTGEFGSGLVTRTTPTGQALEKWQDDVSAIVKQMIAENADSRPILTVPAGSRMQIVLVRDIRLTDDDRIVPADDRQRPDDTPRAEPPAPIPGYPNTPVAPDLQVYPYATPGIAR